MRLHAVTRPRVAPAAVCAPLQRLSAGHLATALPSPPVATAPPPRRALSAILPDARLYRGPSASLTASRMVSSLPSSRPLPHSALRSPLRKLSNASPSHATSGSVIEPFDGARSSPAVERFVSAVRQQVNSLHMETTSEALASARTALEALWRSWPAEVPMVLIPLAQSYLWSELTQGVERVAKNSDKTLLNVLAASSAGLNEWQRMSTLVVCAAKPSAHATTIRLTECFTADGKVPRLFSQQRLLPELVTCDLKSESIWLLAPRNNALPDEDDDEFEKNESHRLFVALCPQASATAAALRCWNFPIAASLFSLNVSKDAHGSAVLSHQLETLLAACEASGAYQDSIMLAPILCHHHVASLSVRARWFALQLRLTLTNNDTRPFDTLARIWHGGAEPSATLPLWREFLAVLRHWTSARESENTSPDGDRHAKALAAMLNDVIGRNTERPTDLVMPVLEAAAPHWNFFGIRTAGEVAKALGAIVITYEHWRPVRHAVLKFASGLPANDLIELYALLYRLGHREDAQQAAQLVLASATLWDSMMVRDVCVACGKLDDTALAPLADRVQTYFVRNDIVAVKGTLARDSPLYGTFLRRLVVRRLKQLEELDKDPQVLPDHMCVPSLPPKPYPGEEPSLRGLLADIDGQMP